jgi:deoxyribodipyrimidine photo-lyase
MSESSSIGIVWFRNDLRLHDHAPLTRAADECDRLLCLYTLPPNWFESVEPGIPKTGAHRVRMLRESVEDLDRQLKQMDQQLLFRRADPAQTLSEVLDTVGSEQNEITLYAYREDGTEEAATESAVAQMLTDREHTLRWFEGQTLYRSADLPFKIEDVPRVFTRFRKKIQDKIPIADPIPSPQQLPAPPDLEMAGDEWPAYEALGLSEPSESNRAVLPFQGGERRALERLRYYLWESDQVQKYKFTRNGMLGADYSSKFSPWLAVGALSPRQIYAELKQYEEQVKSNISTYWLYFELVWRDFFHFTLRKHGADFFKVGGLQQKAWPWKHDEDLFEQWKQAQTGIPLIDANMRELKATGYMSNRGRQNVASFLVHNLQIDWRWGAAYFESQLIDYDPASNWGNWAYVAGVGNDKRNRYFNMLNQGEKYDENGDYIRHWIPELTGLPSEVIHTPWKATKQQLSEADIDLGKTYPKPMIDLEASFEEIKERFKQYG